MRIKSSTILRSAVPLALGLMSMNASAAGPMSSYVPLKAPCQVLDTGTDGFKYIENGSEEGLYRVWAGKDEKGVFHGLKGQGGMDKCVNPMPGMHPTAVVIAVSPRANNGARGNLAVYGEHIKSDDVFGKESTINFWNTNSTNTTIVRVGPHSDKIKIRAKLFATTEAGKKLKLKVTGNVLGFFYENKKDDKHHMEHVIHVGRTGSGTGDYDDILKAMDSIKFSGDSSKWLVKLGPGNFDLGHAQLQMKEYVRIEGSGRHVTKIFGDHGSDNDNDAKSAMVVGANWSVLANLTIKNKGDNDRYDARIAVYNNNVSPSFDNVRIFSHGTASRVCGMSNYGMAAPRIWDSEVEGKNRRGLVGAGFCNHDLSEPDIINTTALGTGIIEGIGVFNAQFARPRLATVRATGSGVVVAPRTAPNIRVGNGIGMKSINGARPVATNSVFDGDIAFSIADGTGSATDPTFLVSIAAQNAARAAAAVPLPPLTAAQIAVQAAARNGLFAVSARLTRITNSTVVNLNRSNPLNLLAAKIVDPFTNAADPLQIQCHNVVDIVSLGLPNNFTTTTLAFASALVPNPPILFAAIPTTPPPSFHNPC